MVARGYTLVLDQTCRTLAAATQEEESYTKAAAQQAYRRHKHCSSEEEEEEKQHIHKRAVVRIEQLEIRTIRTTGTLRVAEARPEQQNLEAEELSAAVEEQRRQDKQPFRRVLPHKLAKVRHGDARASNAPDNKDNIHKHHDAPDNR